MLTKWSSFNNTNVVIIPDFGMPTGQPSMIVGSGIPIT